MRKKILKKKKLNVICHLAAQAGVRYSITNPNIYLKYNIDGFLNILEYCRKNKNTKLVYASSSSVYGANKKQSLIKIHSPISKIKKLKPPKPISLNSASYNILVTDIGGTGVVTIGALIGMAAHLEKKECLF